MLRGQAISLRDGLPSRVVIIEKGIESMNFHFDVKVTAFDFFKMSMKKTYRSPIGVCNIVFTLVAIVLTFRYFAAVSDGIKVLLIILCLIFPVFQPIGIFHRARKLSAGVPKGLTLDIESSGITASVNTLSEKIDWKRVNLLIENKDMLIIKVDGYRGYFLTKKVLKDERDRLIKFAEARLGTR